MGMTRDVPVPRPRVARVAARSKSAVLPICQTPLRGFSSHHRQLPSSIEMFGAGDGNRTHVISLGS